LYNGGIDVDDLKVGKRRIREITKSLHSEEEIRCKIKEMAEEIDRYYSQLTDRIIAVCVLKGAIHFFSELVLNLNLDVLYSFIHVSSYSGTRSSGRVKVNYWIDRSVRDEYVLVVEDILDTGLTLSYILKYLRKLSPKDLKLATLYRKVGKSDIEPDFVGFNIEDKFIIGYGLDYEELYRNLPYVNYFER